MKSNYFLLLVRHLLFTLTFMVGVSASSQSFIIGFPSHSSIPTQNPRDITVCYENTLLKVRLDVAAASTSGASVTVQLPTGVEYVTGSVAKAAGTAALTIADNGGVANAPNLLVGPAALVPGQFMEFTIDRTVLTSVVMNLNGPSIDAYINMYTSQFISNSGEIAVGLNNLMSVEPFTKIKTILL